MMNNMPSGMKKHHESTKPESRQTAKVFFIPLSQWFLHKTAAFYT